MAEGKNTEPVTYFLSRQCLTGVSRYDFHRGEALIGSAAAHVLPTFPISVRVGELAFSAQCDPNQTIVSGAKREMYRDGDPEIWATLCWKEAGKHELTCPLGNLQIRLRNGAYLFCLQDSLIARMRAVPATGSDSLTDNWEHRYELTAEEPLSDELAVLMLAFPLLQIAP